MFNLRRGRERHQSATNPRYDQTMSRSVYNRGWYTLTPISDGDVAVWQRVENSDREQELLAYLDRWEERGGTVYLPNDAAFQEVLGVYVESFLNDPRPADELLHEACSRCAVI